MNSQNNQVLTKKEKRELKRQQKKIIIEKTQRLQTLKRGLSLIGLGFMIILFFYVVFGNKEAPSLINLTINSNDHIKGNREAKVVLIEYSDFQCPACASYYPIIKQLSQEFNNNAMFVYRHFPLSYHQNAFLAASAAEAAGKQGKFWEMHDQIFENQKEWSDQKNAKDNFIKYAQNLKLNIEQFQNDIEVKEIKDKVMADYESGIKAKVNATPTFFLNNEKVQVRSYEEFKKLIETKINQLSNVKEEKNNDQQQERTNP